MKAFVLLLAASAALHAQRAESPKTAAQTKITAQKVIDQYLRAAGGAKALGQVRTESVAGNVTEEATGRRGTYSRILKPPTRFYSEIIMEPERDVEAFNGMSAWVQDSGGVRTLTGPKAQDAEAAGHFCTACLADLKKNQLTAQFEGVEAIRGRDAYRVRVLTGGAGAHQVFFDTQDHLITRESSADEQLDFDDYRPVNGIQAPFRIVLHKGGREYAIAVTRTQFNSSVEDTVFDFPKTSTVPLPDMKELFRDLSKNQKEVEELRKQYTYHLTRELEETDPKAQDKPKTVLEFDVFQIQGGGSVNRLVARNGVALSGDEKEKADKGFNKEFAERTKEQAKREAELANDPKKRAKQEAEDEAAISDFLRAERFINPRRERFRGQEVLAFDFGANPDYKPKSIGDRFIQSLSGMMLVDEQSHEVVRMEGHFNNGFKVAGGVVGSLDKGMSVVFEQAKVNDEVWLPSYTEVHIAARFLLFKLKANQIERFTDYKKFNAESKIVSIEE